MERIPYTPEEVARRGRLIYDEKIRHAAELHDTDKFVVIDIESGDYEIAPADLAATRQMLKRRPEAVIYGLRIGSPFAYRLGSLTTRS